LALSQIIVTSRYLKSGTQKSKNKRRNYTKYIATRETVEVRDQNTIDKNDNATKNQQELLRDLLSDFPEAKRYLEYEDYTANPMDNEGICIPLLHYGSVFEEDHSLGTIQIIGLKRCGFCNRKSPENPPLQAENHTYRQRLSVRFVQLVKGSGWNRKKLLQKIISMGQCLHRELSFAHQTGVA